MKSYSIRFTYADLTQEGDAYLSDVIDLYDNDAYRNFSVTKSGYGVPGKHFLWVGLKDASGAPLDFDDLPLNAETDSGFIEDGRFIDTTGRVDVVYFSASSNAVRMSVYETDDPVLYAEFPDEWSLHGEFEPLQPIRLVGSTRYVRFTFSGPVTDGFEAIVRVAIDPPVMAPLYRSTRVLMDKFPEWMSMRELPEDDGSVVEVEPSNVGATFLNTIASQWLDDATKEISFREFQHFIGSVNLDQMAWCYVAVGIPDEVWSVAGDGLQLAQANDLTEFRYSQGEDVYFIDYERGRLFSVKEYESFEINGDEVEQSAFQVYNYLDEIGLFVDLRRLHLEDNETFKARILDVHKNRGGVGIESLKYALRRELDLWRVYGVEPEFYSEFEGALPELLEVQDIERDSVYFEPDGTPKEAFARLVERLSREYPTTWGRFVWNKALWDVAGPDYVGYGTVPYRYDPDPLDSKFIHSGVGDGDDLLVTHPMSPSGAREVEATLKLRGLQRTERLEYPAVEFDIDMQARGTRTVYSNPENTIGVRITLTTEEGEYEAVTELTTSADIDHNISEPTEASFVSVEIFSEDGTTSSDLLFTHVTTQAPYENDPVSELPEGVIPAASITEVKVSVDTGSNFEVWLSDGSSQTLTSTSGDLTYLVGEEEFTFGEIVFKSTASPTTESVTWYGDESSYELKLNGVSPYLSSSNIEVDIPEYVWPDDVTNRVVELRVTSGNADSDSPELGASFMGAEETEFIPSGFIRANGTALSTGVLGLPLSTETVTFSMVAGIAYDGTTYSSVTPSLGNQNLLYPVRMNVWSPFESEGVNVTGFVSEDGVLDDGVTISTDVLIALDDLSRGDFGVPNSTSHKVTWIEIEDDNEDVLVWLDTNIVKPYGEEDEYPQNSIEETLVAGSYRYDRVVVRARVNDAPNSEWNPQVHSGYFYDRDEEYYLYVDRGEVQFTGDSLILSDVARQGAPIIVRTSDAEPTYLRQVSFFEETDEGVHLTLKNTEYVNGSGVDSLFVAYPDIYDVKAFDGDVDISASSSVDDNVVPTTQITDREKTYRVEYKLQDSFYVDNDYRDGDEVLTRVVIDNASDYSVFYERSSYLTSLHVDIALNPLYSTNTESFIFISHKEYDLSKAIVRLSSGKIVADGVDYIMVTLISLDENGNPKPFQEFTLSTTFGTLDTSSLVTNEDGFAFTKVRSSSSFSGGTAELSVSGAVSATVPFSVEEASEPKPQMLAVMQSDMIPADGESQTVIYGRIQNADFSHNGLEGVDVQWKKARSIYELFTEDPVEFGTAVTDGQGRFVTDSFIAQETEDSGYWFVSLEATVGGVTIGDVVFWYEYPSHMAGAENPDSMPQLPVQILEPAFAPPYASSVKYPTSYDETVSPPSKDELAIEWEPPTWYALPAWLKYQFGLDDHDTYRSL